MRQVKFKRNKQGISVTPCPNGFTTFTGNRPKRAGDDCLMCKYREHVDYDNNVVICTYIKKGAEAAKETPKRTGYIRCKSRVKEKRKRQ